MPRHENVGAVHTIYVYRIGGQPVELLLNKKIKVETPLLAMYKKGELL